MYKRSYVHAIAETKWSFVRVDQLSLEHLEGHEKSKTMQLVEEQFWRKVVKNIYDELTQFQLVLWKNRKEEISAPPDDEIRNEKYAGLASDKITVTVPYVLPPGTYTYDVDYDEDNRKIIKNITVNGLRDENVHYMIGKQGGPNVHDQYFVSDCAAIVDDYYELMDLISDARETRKSNIKRFLFIEHLQPNEYSKDEEIIAQVQSFTSSKKTESGYTEYFPHEIVTQDDFKIIPVMHRIAPHQPPPLPNIEVDESIRNFKGLLSDLFRVPSMFNEERSTGVLSNSDAKIDEQRRRLHISVSEMVEDIVGVLQAMFQTIYKKNRVPIRLPINIMTDIDKINELFAYGYISDDVAKEEVQLITGINAHRMRKGKLHPPEQEAAKKKHKKNNGSR